MNKESGDLNELAGEMGGDALDQSSRGSDSQENDRSVEPGSRPDVLRAVAAIKATVANFSMPAVEEIPERPHKGDQLAPTEPKCEGIVSPRRRLNFRGPKVMIPLIGGKSKRKVWTGFFLCPGQYLHLHILG